MKKVRQSTVEPVFGTLINFMGMGKLVQGALNKPIK